MFFGYYVAWRNPELRVLRRAGTGNLLGVHWRPTGSSPWLYGFRVARSQSTLFACTQFRSAANVPFGSRPWLRLFLACWTTPLLLPNPLMPPSLARSHFCETPGLSLSSAPSRLAAVLYCHRRPQVEKRYLGTRRFFRIKPVHPPIQ